MYRYVLLMKELLKYSNQTHPDYAYLERAHAKVRLTHPNT
jgi:hypothetical protein